MFERFTERARQVIVLAQDNARGHKAKVFGPGDILIGLLREDEGLAAGVLKELGVTLDKVREGLDTRMTRMGDDGSLTVVPPSPQAKIVLDMALREALALGHNYIGTEHLLMGLVRKENLALEILEADFSLTEEKVRRAVVDKLSGPKAPILKRDKESTPTVYYNLRKPEGAVETSDSDLRRIMIEAVEIAQKYPGRDPGVIVHAVLQMNGKA
jgi:ATP-dependent Clp protease ATP-binding subunit ClpA